MIKGKLKLSNEPLYSQKKRRNVCVVSHCGKSTAKGYVICFKHKREKQKLENPSRYWFDVLRQNARRRQKEFSLTIEEFRKFCAETNYLELKGRSAGMYTIDRKDNKKGYEYGNLQILTVSQNSRKQWIDLKIQYGGYPTEEELKELYGDFDPFKIEETEQKIEINEDDPEDEDENFPF